MTEKTQPQLLAAVGSPLAQQQISIPNPAATSSRNRFPTRTLRGKLRHSSTTGTKGKQQRNTRTSKRWPSFRARLVSPRHFTQPPGLHRTAKARRTVSQAPPTTTKYYPPWVVGKMSTPPFPLERRVTERNYHNDSPSPPLPIPEDGMAGHPHTVLPHKPKKSRMPGTNSFSICHAVDTAEITRRKMAANGYNAYIGDEQTTSVRTKVQPSNLTPPPNPSKGRGNIGEGADASCPIENRRRQLQQPRGRFSLHYPPSSAVSPSSTRKPHVTPHPPARLT